MIRFAFVIVILGLASNSRAYTEWRTVTSKENELGVRVIVTGTNDIVEINVLDVPFCYDKHGLADAIVHVGDSNGVIVSTSVLQSFCKPPEKLANAVRVDGKPGPPRTYLRFTVASKLVRSTEVALVYGMMNATVVFKLPVASFLENEGGVQPPGGANAAPPRRSP